MRISSAICVAVRALSAAVRGRSTRKACAPLMTPGEVLNCGLLNSFAADGEPATTCVRASK